MAKEPENLVLEHLRNIRADVKSIRADLSDVRGDLNEVRNILGDHSRRFDFLEERVEMLREGTLTAIGFAANAGKLQHQIADLTKGVERLEQAK